MDAWETRKGRMKGRMRPFMRPFRVSHASIWQIVTCHHLREGRMNGRMKQRMRPFMRPFLRLPCVHLENADMSPFAEGTHLMDA